MVGLFWVVSVLHALACIALIEHLDKEEKHIPGTPVCELPPAPTLARLWNLCVVGKTLSAARKTLTLRDSIVWGQRAAETEEHLETLTMLSFLINHKREQWGCSPNKGFGLESILFPLRTFRNVTTPKEDNTDQIGLFLTKQGGSVL